MDDGRLTKVGERWQLEFTRELSHPPDKVWRALTEPAHLTAWFPTEIVGERAAGAALRFEFRNGEGPSFDGEILVYQPTELLEFRWGDDLLCFELVALGSDGARTRLVLTDTFAELGKAARDAAGWHTCLDLLGFDLSGEKPPWASEEVWREVHPRYEERFGPEASTIGPPESIRGGDA